MTTSSDKERNFDKVVIDAIDCVDTKGANIYIRAESKQLPLRIKSFSFYVEDRTTAQDLIKWLKL